ncbi:MAG: radical SAM protein [Candidatus Woesearchaeota archaeon]
MRVLLANPPWNEQGRKGVRAGSRWPHLKTIEEGNYLPYPFFLGYSSRLLKDNGFEVLFVDALAEELSLEDFLKKIKVFNPDFILLEVSTPSLENDLRIIRKIRDFSKAAIAVAGMDYSIRQPEFLANNHYIDFVLYGEYEFTLLETVQHLKSNNSLHDVKGLIYKEKETGRIVINPPRHLEDINKLPWPDRKSVPIYKYLDAPGEMPLPCAQMLASRGCPFQCNFCAWPQIMFNGSNYRFRNVKDVVDEMEFLVRKMGFKSIYFDDDTFNIGKERMLEFANEVKKRNLNVPFAIMARADLMDEEILKVLKEAGLFAVKYGVESSEQKLLDNCNKNMDIRKVEEIIKLTKSLGIRVHLTFTFGLPGETKETIEKTIKFALEQDPFSVQFSITTPFPGTKYYDELKEKNELVYSKLSDFDGNFKAVIKTKELSPKDLELAVARAYKIWNEHLKHRSLKIKNNQQNNQIKKAPTKIVSDCLKEHGLLYTAEKICKHVVNGKIFDYLGYYVKISSKKSRKKISDNQSKELNLKELNTEFFLRTDLYVLPELRTDIPQLYPIFLCEKINSKVNRNFLSVVDLNIKCNNEYKNSVLNKKDFLSVVFNEIKERNKLEKSRNVYLFYAKKRNLENTLKITELIKKENKNNVVILLANKNKKFFNEKIIKRLSKSRVDFAISKDNGDVLLEVMKLIGKHLNNKSLVELQELFHRKLRENLNGKKTRIRIIKNKSPLIIECFKEKKILSHLFSFYNVDFTDYDTERIPIIVGYKKFVKNPLKILMEVDYYRRNNEISEFLFLNSEIYDENNVLELCEHICLLNYKIRFGLTIDSNKINNANNVVSKLKESGCNALYLVLNKKTDIKRFLEVAKTASKKNIAVLVNAYFIENKKEIFLGLNRAKDYVDGINFFFVKDKKAGRALKEFFDKNALAVIESNLKENNENYEEQNVFNKNNKETNENHDVHFKNRFSQSLKAQSEEPKKTETRDETREIKFGDNFKTLGELRQILEKDYCKPEELEIMEINDFNDKNKKNIVFKKRKNDKRIVLTKKLNFIDCKTKPKFRIIINKSKIKELVKDFTQDDYEFISKNLDVLGVINGKNAFTGPRTVEIDLSAKCNNNCVACWHYSPYINKIEDSYWRDTVLDFEVAKKLVDDLKELGTEYIFICGSGEPMVNPKTLEIIEYIRNKGIECGLNTNGTLLNPKFIRRIVELGMNRLHVSLWASNPKTYVKTHPIMKEKVFLNIKENLKLLDRLKKKLKKKKPEVDIVNVILKLNFKEMKEMIKFAKEVGASRVQFQVMDVVPGKTDFLMLSKEEINFVLNEIPRLKEFAEKNKIELFDINNFENRLRNILGNYEEKFYDKTTIEKNPCYIGWLYSRISAQGLCYTCSKWHGSHYYGNLFELNFRDAWFSEKQNIFRQATLNKDLNFGYFPLNECYKYCCDIERNNYMLNKLKNLSGSEIIVLGIAESYIRNFNDADFLKRIKAKNFRIV